MQVVVSYTVISKSLCCWMQMIEHIDGCILGSDDIDEAQIHHLQIVDLGIAEETILNMAAKGVGRLHNQDPHHGIL